VTIGSFLAAAQIQGLLILNNKDYTFRRWHGTLLIIAIVLFVLIFNTLAKHLPLFEGLVLCLHLGGSIAVLVPLWVLGPRGNSHEIWAEFSNFGGWPSSKHSPISQYQKLCALICRAAGLSTLVGLYTPTTAFLGADAAVHMAEGLKDASRNLPRVVMWTSGVNGALESSC